MGIVSPTCCFTYLPHTMVRTVAFHSKRFTMAEGYDALSQRPIKLA